MPVAEQLASPRRHRLGSASTARPTPGCGRPAAPGRARCPEKPVVALVSATTPDVGERVDEQRRLEAGHRAGVAGQHAAGVRQQADAEPVVDRRRHRLAHLGQGLVGQHVGVAQGEERGEPREVLDRAPQLTGGRHRPGVVRAARGSGCWRGGARSGRGRTAPAGRYDVRVIPSGSSTRSCTSSDHGPPAQPGHGLAEQPEAEVAVVVVLPRPEDRSRCRRWPRAGPRPVTPGERSHHGPTGSLCIPETWASSDAHGRRRRTPSPAGAARSGRRGRAARRRGTAAPAPR